MEIYKDIDRDSNVSHFEIGDTYIHILESNLMEQLKFILIDILERQDVSRR